MASPLTEALSAPERSTLTALLEAPTYEVIPLPDLSAVAAALPASAAVAVTVSVRLGLHATLHAAAWLAARGHDVKPHIAARLVRDRVHLAEVIATLQDAGIRRIFVVGGDGPPAGEFSHGLSLLTAVADLGRRFEEVGVPAYPEGHPSIPPGRLLHDLRAKQQFAHTMTTQMSFNPDAVGAWLRQVRRAGVTLPVHLGIPGVMGLRKLLGVAGRIGIGESGRYLLKNPALIGHLVQRASFAPDALLRRLAPALADIDAQVHGLHLFTMNQVEATVTWQRRMYRDLALDTPLREHGS